MKLLPMPVRGVAQEPMFRGDGPDIRGRSNASVIKAAKAFIQATGGSSPFSVEIVNKRCGHAVLLTITTSAIRNIDGCPGGKAARWPSIRVIFAVLERRAARVIPIRGVLPSPHRSA